MELKMTKADLSKIETENQRSTLVIKSMSKEEMLIITMKVREMKP